MLWVRVLGAILIWFPSNHEALRTQQRGSGTKSYQISPKPCEVNNLKGTCMFVWECIKSEGEHLGMCVDSFMFGSCCSHNAATNAIGAGGLDGDEDVNDYGNGPAILYSPPITTTTYGPPLTTRRPTLTSSSHHHMTTTYQHFHKPYVKKNNTNSYYTSSTPGHQYNTPSSHNKPSGYHNNTKKPSFSNTQHSFLTSAATSYPTHKQKLTTTTLPTTINSQQTNTFVQPDGIIATSHRPDSSWQNRPQTSSPSTSVWHVTTEPNFVTKVRPSNNYNTKPSSIIILNHKTKPTKKPILSTIITTTTTTTTIPPPTTTTTISSTASTSTQKISNQYHTKPIYVRPNQTTTLNLIKPTTLNLVKNETASNNGANNNHSNSGPNYMPDKQNFDPRPPMLTQHLTSTEENETPSPTSESLMPTSTLISVSAASGDRQARCGVTPLFPMRPEKRIVGGKNAPFGRWPWQVSVRRTSFFGFSSTHRCGGAILNENWIATAGHCVDDLLTSQIRIRVGEYDFSKTQEEFPFVERMVAKKVVHPKYNFFTYEYDLALVRLDKPLEFAPHISPICLPASDDLLIGENATVTGWGRLSEGGTLPSVLQEVQVPIVSNDRCKSMFLRAGRHEYIPEIFLCAGHEGGGMDSCQGDSGGPLQVKGRDGRYFLAGIISWGIGCAEANLPGVCTRISKFVPWILENVT